jgi:hypothetical protein
MTLSTAYVTFLIWGDNGRVAGYLESLVKDQGKPRLYHHHPYRKQRCRYC